MTRWKCLFYMFEYGTHFLEFTMHFINQLLLSDSSSSFSASAERKLSSSCLLKWLCADIFVMVATQCERDRWMARAKLTLKLKWINAKISFHSLSFASCRRQCTNAAELCVRADNETEDMLLDDDYLYIILSRETFIFIILRIARISMFKGFMNSLRRYYYLDGNGIFALKFHRTFIRLFPCVWLTDALTDCGLYDWRWQIIIIRMIKDELSNGAQFV